MDNFIVSARKYRPATFDSVVGQSHITSTLQNAIAREQLAHAYLFCGPRGVGKTTCARIFAKSINCLSPAGSEACGECESCRAFDEGRSFNIHELDAASNNSVDDIRSLTEQVRIPPQIGRYSVYIIDEVHMLSQAAFNAFLKTLEEPPAHAIFILATTEKHKIIPTILSRCQIYDFNRIRVEDSVSYLKRIASREGISYDDESLNLIASKADGGMRDALSMFDKAVAFCGKSLNFREVARTLNVLDYDTYFTVTNLAAAGDYKGALLLFDEVLRKGFSAQTFAGGLASHLRDLLMCKDAATMPLLEAAGTLLERYRKQSAELETAFLFQAVDLINSVDSSLRGAVNTRLHVELGLMKLCSLGQKKSGLTASEPPLPSTSGNSNRPQSNPAAPMRTGNDEKSPEAHTQAGMTPSPAADAAAKKLRQENSGVTPRTTPAGSTEANGRDQITPSDMDAAAKKLRQEEISSSGPQQDTLSGQPKEVPGLRTTDARKETERGTPDGASSCNKAANRSLSGVSISSILKGEPPKEAASTEESASAGAAFRGVDPESELKINSAKSAFIESLSRNRPRFATAFCNMKVTGNRIYATVSTDLLRDDIVQHQKELANLLREVSDLKGQVEFEIDVKEDKSAVKPIKPEDKLTHLRSKNACIDDLRRELDLELE